MGKIIKKIEVFFLFLTCLFYRLFKKRANKKNKVVKKFFFIEMSKMGDTICATPLFKAVKDNVKDSIVCVLAGNVNSLILENNPFVDKIIVYDKKSFFKIIREIRSENFDIGICINPNFLGLSFLCLSGIGCCIAPTIKRSNVFDRGYYKIIRKMFAVSVEYKFGEYVPRQYLKLLEFVGIFSENVKKTLGFSNDAKKKIEILLIDNGIILGKDIIISIHVGAGNRLKLWGFLKWVELINQLGVNNKCKVVLLGGKHDLLEVGKILPLLDKKFINFSNILNIDELKAMINYSDILISTDSGPIYIAEAFNKYTIDITGPVDEREQPPSPPYYQKGYLVFNSNLFCRPCSFIFQTARSCRYNNLKCFSEVEMSDVLAVIDKVLVKINKNA
jgi:ADP-heptose:LPS heptosyltransferase